MAELCVNLSEESSGDPYTDAKRYKYGDVVCVQEDGWKWGAAEMSGQFTIVKVPGEPVANFSAFMAQDTGDSKVDRMMKRRTFALDLARLDVSTEVKLSAVLDVKIMKAALDDPAKL